MFSYACVMMVAVCMLICVLPVLLPLALISSLLVTGGLDGTTATIITFIGMILTWWFRDYISEKLVKPFLKIFNTDKNGKPVFNKLIVIGLVIMNVFFVYLTVETWYTKDTTLLVVGLLIDAICIGLGWFDLVIRQDKYEKHI